MKHPEFDLQKSICRYLDIQYPRVLYLSDTVASVKLTIPQQVRNKSIQKDGFKCPDLLILEPRNGFSGLFIELKTDTPYKKNGDLKSNKHLIGQEKTISELKAKGYKATFSWGFDMTKEIIDEYFKKKPLKRRLFVHSRVVLPPSTFCAKGTAGRTLGVSFKNEDYE